MDRFDLGLNMDRIGIGQDEQLVLNRLRQARQQVRKFGQCVPARTDTHTDDGGGELQRSGRRRLVHSHT